MDAGLLKGKKAKRRIRILRDSRQSSFFFKMDQNMKIYVSLAVMLKCMEEKEEKKVCRLVYLSLLVSSMFTTSNPLPYRVRLGLSEVLRSSIWTSCCHSVESSFNA